MSTMLEELEKLNDHQKRILKEFREELQDVLTDEHDDPFLLRFLKAREFNKNDAGSMLRKNLQFRKEMGADTVLVDYEIPEICRKKMPTRTLGYDKDGRVVRYFFLGNTDFKGIVEVLTKHEIVKFCIATYEHDLNEMRINNERTGKKADTITVIQDWKGLSIKQFANKKVVESVMESVKALEANYPERVYRMAVIRAPAVFSVVYGLIKPLLAEATKSKILFLDGENWKTALVNLVGSAILPKHLGGTQEDDDGEEEEENFLSRQRSKSLSSA